MQPGTTVAERSAMLQMFKQCDKQTYNKARGKAKELKMPLGHFIVMCVERYLNAD